MDVMQFDQRMTDYEALMWNIEKDPWLSSNIGSVTILDRPPDFDELRARLRNAASEIPRLRQRVLSGLGRFAPPTWVTDQEFDLDYHLRHVALPSAGTRRDLLDFASDLLQDPFDRTRPLWQFYVVDGLEDGRAAMFSKLHHTLADGMTAVVLASHYMTFERDADLPDAADLERIIADERTQQTSVTSQAIDAAGEVTRKAMGVAASSVSEMIDVIADRERMRHVVGQLVDTVRFTSDQLAATESKASPLWAQRSRHRHLETLAMPFRDFKDAASRRGGKINDLFLAGAIEAATRYHEARGLERDYFTVSFVVNTRTDDASDSAGNKFTIVPVDFAGAPMKLADRFDAVRDRAERIKDEVRGSGRGSELLNALSGVMNLLPTSVLTTTTRNRAANLDFATSNVPASPVPMYIGGAEMLEIYPMGPLAGTAFNSTMLSYDGTFYMGINVDPDAVDDPALLRRLMDDAYTELIGTS